MRGSRFYGRLKAAACLVLAAVLAAAAALGTAAAEDTEPVPDSMRVRSSRTHTLALHENALYGWGANDRSQLPGFTEAFSTVPVKLLDGVADMAAAPYRSLVVFADGTLRQYGRDPVTGRSFSAGVLLAENAVQAAASATFSAFVTDEGALYTLGENYSYQLGNCPEWTSTAPVQVFASGVKKISVGDSFALALMEDGAVYGWGDNSAMQLGTDTEERPVTAPRQIASGIADIAAGFCHSLLLTEDGELYACGDNAYNQVGVEEESAVPLTKLLDNVTSISAGEYHSAAITAGGTVYFWGYNRSGQLGNGTVNRAATPQESQYDFTRVFAGADSTFGLSPQGSLYAFGDNNNYVLGKEDGTNSLYPVRILTRDMEWVYDPEAGADEFFHENGNHHQEEPSPTPTASPAASAAPRPTARPVDPTAAPTESPTPAPSDTPLPSASPTASAAPSQAPSAEPGASPTPVPSESPSAAPTDTPAPSLAPSLSPELSPAPSLSPSASPVPARGFVNGYADGTFRPDNDVTRAEFLKLLVAALGEDLDGLQSEGLVSSDLFTDVAPDDWFASYVFYAKRRGLVKGYEDGSFRPNGPITRAEAAQMTANFLGLDLDNAPSAGFTDLPDGHWAAAAVNALAATQTLTGYEDGSFRPAGNIARREAVTLVAKAAGFLPGPERRASLARSYPASPFSDVSPEAWYYAYLLRAVGYVR